MKSKINPIESARLRKDYFFSRLVTGFGLLVLATFAALIVHILLNAAPLLKSPSLSENSSNTDSTAFSNVKPNINNSLGRIIIDGHWLNLSVHECALVVTPIVASNDTSKRFAPNCNKTILGLLQSFDDNRQYVVMLNNNNILELYILSNDKKLFLQNSFKVPPEFLSNTQGDWHFARSQEQIIIRRDLQSNLQPNLQPNLQQQPGQSNTQLISGTLLLEHSLASFNTPVIKRFEGAKTVIPMLRFNQFIGVYPNLLQIFNEDKQVIQEISLEADSMTVSLSPSMLDLYVLTKQTNAIVRYSFSNQQGQFLLKEDFKVVVPQDFAKYPSIIHYDLSHDAAFVFNQQGQTLLFNTVTGDIEYQYDFAQPILFADYEASSVVLGFDEGVRQLHVTDWQGMISLQLLFGQNTHAGYPEPSYVWQTSVSSATQSPKYNIIPLLMGSIKASLLALIVALPLALGAAIYTAYFASSHIRNAIKPSIEMLEAIPSVIIGFIAAVWLAPFAEQYLMSIFWVIILLPFVVLCIAGIHGFLSTRLPPSKIGNWQLAINASLLLIAIISIFTLSLLVTQWSQSVPYNLVSDAVSNLTLSKTAIVVSLALGVAIAPTLYTLIDDALYEVPEGVKQASFALGATQIQTLVKVVLVVAFPSIVSAVMLGFGRAFGETMIVLMVTGNTPIANWDLLSGLRTLTSNLAIELQEAQVDSTLYHILFLTAAVLFVFTFLINTVAALLKRRLNVYGE